MRNFYYLCTLLLIMIISSCKTATKVVEIPVETIKKEYINKVDTILKTDTIPKVITVEKQVEVNHIYWWQKSLMWLGGILFSCIIIFLYYKFKL